MIQIEVQSTNDASVPFRMLEYLVLVTRVQGRVPKQILLALCRPQAIAHEPSDNVLGILARLGNDRATLRGIIEKLSRLQRDEADFYFQALLVLAGLRGLEEVVQDEARNMPTIDLSENKVLGSAHQRGLQEGRHEGQIDMLRRLIESKFGALPSWAEPQLAQASGEALEKIGLRVFAASTLDDLLR